MISKWKNGSASEVIAKAQDIAKDMESCNICVVRTKMESIAQNMRVPCDQEEFEAYGDKTAYF